MRAAPFATIVGLTLGLLSQHVLARAPLSINPATPASYDAAKSDLDKIQPYLEASQCGGWQDRSVEGAIAAVKGVPGRNGVWNGAILSGMGTRKDENNNTNIDDDFIFPDTGVGLTTACKDGKTDITKKVWRETGPRDGEISQTDITYPHPKFEDPSCRWRPKINGVFQSAAPDVPLKPLDQYDPAPDYGELDQEPDNRQSPPNCINFCQLLNSYQYYDCLETGTGTDTVTGDPYTICNKWGNKFLCTDQQVEGADVSCIPGPHGAGSANARGCVGAQCRCENDGGPNPGNGCEENPGTKQDEAPVYYSYSRFYTGEYSRDAITTDKGNDVASDKGPVACYGFYDEFDPKVHKTEDKDRRCVIDLNVVDRRDTQTGKDQYGQNSNIVQRDPNDAANQRAPSPAANPGSYDAAKDLWYEKLGGGFSLLNEKVFSDSYNKDLTNVFLNTTSLDAAQMRATEQLGTRRPFANGSYIRSFDDTGERSVVSWWQTQQSAVAAIMHPPIIRMILPSGWAMGVDLNDPFFVQREAKILKPADKRNDRIEVQINADEDTIGAVLSYLRRSMLLHVKAEPVRAVLPVGSAVEFRSKAEAWCNWYMRRSGTTSCDHDFVPANVAALIDTLNGYAIDIEQYRGLRAEMANYASDILNVQQSVTKPITDWMSKNINAYKLFLEQQRQLQAGLGTEWRKAQEAYETFGGKTNMPWCMNQRFTLPIYSLLDGWLPARSNAGDRSAIGLPVITADSNADIVLDLSTVAFMSGSVVLPIIDPVQVRVTDFPSPPSSNMNATIPASYPDLPSITDIRDALRRSADALPKPARVTEVIPPISLKQIDWNAVGQQLNVMQGIEQTIADMTDRYDKFWKSIGPLKADEPGQDDRNGIKQMKEHLECFSWNDPTCQHVEMDLRERFQRIGSRPLVFLREDYESKDEARLISNPCVGQNDVCTPIHPEEGGEKHLWEVIGPRNVKETLGDLRTAVRNATLPAPVGTIPSADFAHYGTPTKNLLPSYDVPEPIGLTPPPAPAQP